MLESKAVRSSKISIHVIATERTWLRKNASGKDTSCCLRRRIADEEGSTIAAQIEYNE